MSLRKGKESNEIRGAYIHRLASPPKAGSFQKAQTSWSSRCMDKAIPSSTGNNASKKDYLRKYLLRQPCSIENFFFDSDVSSAYALDDGLFFKTLA